MHFKRVRLTGFKSFVDPTELVIEPGLTGIVGPNGCGKSNLLEAIRWAMGEASAKSLRGAGMEDVIFAGTGKRAARHMAEVSLVLDNQDRSAPNPYNSEDSIEITRRIERDSGSAYRVNGMDVRQKDVRLLFADAATGAQSPALVSQGRIGSLISAQAKERRLVLEEAAGISGLHVRRKEAEQRLRAAATNLARAQDMLDTMSSQANSLKRQARQAARYRALSEAIEKAEAAVFYARWSVAATAAVEQENQNRAHIQAASETEQALSKAARAGDRLQEQIQPLRDAAIEAAAALQRLEQARDRLEADEQRRLETESRLQEDHARALNDLEREAERLEDAATMVARLASEAAGLSDTGTNDSDQLDKAQAALKQAGDAANALEARYDEEASKLADARARKSSMESDLLTFRRRRDQARLELERFTLKKDQLEASTGLAARLKAADHDLKEAESSALEAADTLKQAQADLDAAQGARDAARVAENQIQGELKALVGSVSGLERVIASAEAQIGVSVLKDISAKAGYENALAAAVIDLDNTGVDPSDRRHMTALGPWQQDQETPQNAEALGSYVSVPKPLERLVSSSFLVTETEAEDAQKTLSPGQQLVTVAGALYRADGLVVKAGAESKTASLMADRNRLEGMKADLASRKSALEKAEAESQTTDDALKAVRDRGEAARAAMQACDKALNEKRRALIAIEGDAARLKTEIDSVEASVKRITTELAQHEKDHDSIQDKIDALPETESLESALSDLRQDVEAARQDMAAARAAYDGIQREQQARRDQIAQIKQDQKAWEGRQAQSTAQKAALEKRVVDTQSALKSLAGDPDALQAKRATLSAQLDAARSELAGAKESQDLAEAALHESVQARKQAETAHTVAREAVIRSEATLEGLLERRRDAATEIGKRFDVQPTALLERFDLPPADQLDSADTLETDFDRLQRERDHLGAVNLRADIELEEMTSSISFQEAERKEIETAIARLRGAINSLNREGREKLLAAFDIVDAHFKELFTGLFGGGEARLALVDSDDPLEAGLEIYASPPGKKMQVLSLLSGGEQALTALSLIFAVFNTKPAPICILDEVDAPLDDANVERFCNLLKTMVDRTETRFLIVTHNAVTMSHVSRLFGVTMAERGVSTLVSVDLDKAADILTESN